MNHAAQPKRPLSDDPHFAQAVQNYEAGLRALQERKFEKAKGLFQKVVAGGIRELTDRASVHLISTWTAPPTPALKLSKSITITLSR
jgi:hypothetical protein